VNTAIIGDAPAEVDAATDLSVDELLGEIAADREEQAEVIEKAPAAAPVAEAVPAPVETQDDSVDVSPSADAAPSPAEPDDSERERLLDELLAQ
jgi:hypothetical protein